MACQSYAYGHYVHPQRRLSGVHCQRYCNSTPLGFQQESRFSQGLLRRTIRHRQYDEDVSCVCCESVAKTVTNRFLCDYGSLVVLHLQLPDPPPLTNLPI